jgi:hypothetical protein
MFTYPATSQKYSRPTIDLYDIVLPGRRLITAKMKQGSGNLIRTNPGTKIRLRHSRPIGWRVDGAGNDY